MPTIRVNFFFQQQGYGWTDTQWTQGTDTDIRAYFAKANALAAKRIACSGAQTFLTAVRISAEGIFRDATGTFYPGDGLQGTATQISDAPATALLIGMKDVTATKARNVFLRGVWDSCVDEGGKFIPTAAYTAKLNAYFAELTQQNWGWLGATSRNVANVMTATQDPSGVVLVSVNADLFVAPFPVLGSVRISGVLGATQLNGQQIISGSAARNFSTRRRISIFPYTTGGKVTFNTKAFIPVLVCATKRIVERKPGRPSYLSAGRRKARAAS
jgi:hypothetical protein